MTFYADSSAIVKLYVPEVHHEAVQALGGAIVVSALARVEVPAAVWRKQRRAEIGADDAALLCAEFVADVAGVDEPSGRFVVVAVSDEVITEASGAVSRYALRAYDAVQLATALVVRRALDGLDGFAAFDVDLRAAAAAEGLPLVPAVLDRRPRVG